MTHDRTKPPSKAPSSRDVPPPDEIMARVVGVWKGISLAFPEYSVKTGELTAFRYGFTGERVEVVDPRTDTDAALELLGWLYARHDIDVQIDALPGEKVVWEISQCENEPELGMGKWDHQHIPLSGEPFRVAVCWLAVDVLGVG